MMKKPLLFFKKCKVNNSDSMVFKDLWLIVHAQEIVFLAAEKSIELDCLKDLLRGEVEPSIGHAYVYNEKIDLEKAGEWLSEHIYCFSKEETIISNISVVVCKR
ncbi:MAG: hypothetical protein Q4B26_07005 [Eubacteriales bacterium]|nr:hypothetical protein [Eubacteriales bacterium]